MKSLKTRGPSDGLGAAVVSLGAALGLLVGLRAMVALELPGLRSLLSLPPLPRESFGLIWSPRAVWPVDIQSGALEGVLSILAVLLLAGVMVGLLNALIVLVEAGASRRQELAIKAALGCSPLGIGRILLGPVRRVVTTSTAMGLVLGLALGALLRLTWPGGSAPVGVLEAAGELFPPVMLLLVLSAYAYAAVGLRVDARGGLVRGLGHGGRLTDDRGAVAFRRSLAALQMGAAGAVAVAGFFLASGLTGGVPETAGDAPAVTVMDAESGGSGADWEAVLAAVRAVPGVRAESLATPGALVGIGVRDYATADCGYCQRGDLIVPFIPAWVDHHAVAPGFFDLVGQEVLEGRPFTAADDADAPLVAVVNRTFANSSFQEGDAVGRSVRLGRGTDDWFTVVGIVADAPARGLGSTAQPLEAVYVSALQRAPTHAVLMVLPSTEEAPSLSTPLETMGVTVGEVTLLADRRRAAAAPRRWAAALAATLGGLILLLAASGTRTVTAQVARRQEHELGIRRVLGATDGRILAYVLAGSTRTAAWGTAVTVFFGSLAVALLRQGFGSVSPAGPVVYVTVAGILVVTALASSWRAARASTRVQPVVALE